METEERYNIPKHKQNNTFISTTKHKQNNTFISTTHMVVLHFSFLKYKVRYIDCSTHYITLNSM